MKKNKVKNPDQPESEVKEDVVKPSRKGKHAGRGSPKLNDKQFEATRRFWW